MQTTLTDRPQYLFTIGEYDSQYPKGWFVVYPKSTQLDLAAEDKANAAFRLYQHAKKYAGRWMPFVEIIQNGENEE